MVVRPFQSRSFSMYYVRVVLKLSMLLFKFQTVFLSPRFPEPILKLVRLIPREVFRLHRVTNRRNTLRSIGVVALHAGPRVS